MTLGKLAEGEELETNLLQASQRNPASSDVLDGFSAHTMRKVSRVPPET